MTEERQDEDGILSPKELTVTDDDRVRELDDNRFVISTGDDEPSLNSPPENVPDVPENDRPERTPMTDVESQYAVDVALKNGERVTKRRITSNSVVEPFEALLLWYADRVGDGDTPPEEVARILLAETSLVD